MMFKKRFHAGIIDGSITCTFRYWKRMQVKVGNFYKINPIGHIQVTEITHPNPSTIRKKEALASGFASIDSMREYLDGFAGSSRQLYKVNFRFAGHPQGHEPDQSSLASDSDFREVEKALAVRDRNSRVGPWTSATLRMISINPGLSSAILAERLNRERVALKRDVRKLKKLGLTISLEVGYKLSARGQTYVDWIT